MKTRALLFLLLALCCIGCKPEEPEEELGLSLDSETFLDDGFRTYLEVNFDTDGNGVLDEEEILAVDTIVCRNMGIRIISHLEKFVNLRYLDCRFNELVCLDLSGHPALSHVNVHCATSLDLSGCPALSYVDCRFSSALRSLDLSGCPALRTLDCSGCALTSLDLSGFPALRTLDCSYNALRSLDLSGCPALRTLVCRYNALTSLDVSGNPLLDGLSARGQKCSVDVDLNNQFDLRQLGLDMEKVYNWSGGIVEGTMLTFTGREVSYMYRTGLESDSISGSMDVILFCTNYQE